ncbi:MAG: hypothetical protein WC889_02850 [Myxococcota bacterium]
MSDPITPETVASDVADPLGSDPDGVLFRRLKSWTMASLEHLADWRKEAEEAYDFYSGHQWTDAERAIFEGDGRVAPIFNLVAINIDAVCGLEVNNRQDVKYLPRTQGDVKVNDLLSSAAMWVRDEAQSEDEESDAFKDATICGLGVTETRKPDPETIDIDRRDPTECFYDKSAKKPNLIDRRYGGRVVMMDTDEAETMFPDIGYHLLNAKWASLGLKDSKEKTELLDYPTEQRAGLGSNDDPRPKKVCLVEVEWYDWDAGKRVYKQAFLGAAGILEVNPLDAWAYNWMTGKRDKRANTWYGIMRALKDPQKMINKFLATVTHILATNAKGGMLVEEGVFANPADAERDWSNPQKNVTVVNGALAQGRIQPRVAPPLPAGAIQLIEFALGNIRNVSGINVELLGAADRDQPASLEMQRRQSAVTILASLFDSKRRYHKEQGRTLLALMKTLPPEMLVRVTVDPSDPILMPPLPPGIPPEQQQQAMQQWQQQVAGQEDAKKREIFMQFQVVSKAFEDPTMKFDVIVDEAPTSPNQQQEVVAKLSMLASQGMQIPPEGQAIILRNIGLPSTVADELAKAIGQQAGENPQMAQLAQALQQAQQAAAQGQQELQTIKADRSNETAKLKIEAFKADTDRMKVKGELELEAADDRIRVFEAAIGGGVQ